MVTAEELVVSITSTGTGEAREDLEGMEEAMEDTAESSRDASEDLTDFTQRIKGALSAAAAGVAIAAGALLSQIPIIGEFVAGLGAIFDALGLQVDQLIRDLGGEGLTTVLFDAANAINNLEGGAADLAGALTIIGTIITGVIAGIAAWAVKTMGFIGAASALVGVLKTVAAAIAGVIAGISATAAAIAIAIAAIAAFAVAYATNFKGVRDTTNRIIGQIINFVVSGVNTLVTQALNVLGGFADRVGQVFNGIASGLQSWASGVAQSAREWGENLIERFISGIRSAIGRLRNFLNDLREVGTNVGIDVPNLGSLGGGGGGGGGGSSSRPAFGGAGGSGIGTQIDGRQLTESTGRYRSDPSRRRGL